MAVITVPESDIDMVVVHDTGGAILSGIDKLVWSIECDGPLICSAGFEGLLKHEEWTRFRLFLSLDDAAFDDRKFPTLEKERFLSFPNSGAGDSVKFSSTPARGNAHPSPLLPAARESPNTGTDDLTNIQNVLRGRITSSNRRNVGRRIAKPSTVPLHDARQK